MAKKYQSKVNYAGVADPEIEVGMDQPTLVEGVDVSREQVAALDANTAPEDYLEAERDALGNVTIDAVVAPTDDKVTPTVTIVTPADDYGRPISEKTLAEMQAGREALKHYNGYVEPFADDHNGQQRGNFEAPKLQFAEVNPALVPTFSTVATPFVPGQE